MDKCENESYIFYNKMLLTSTSAMKQTYEGLNYKIHLWGVGDKDKCFAIQKLS